MTKVFLQFLSDFRETIITETNTVWLGGKLNPAEAEGNRAQANMLEEMVDLAFIDIADFYENPDQEENGNEG